MADRILRAREVMHKTGLSQTTIWRRERDGIFPRRRSLGNHAIGWLESEVDDWLQTRPPAATYNSKEAAS